MLNSRFFTLLSLLLITNFIIAQTCITNVTVVDVENHKMIANQDVCFNNGLITKIQKTNASTVPDNYETIDGTNKYLIPGLVDAHIHFFQNGGLYSRPDAIDLRAYQNYDDEIALTKTDMEAKLKRYLKNGITTVVDVGSTFSFLEQRKSFSNQTSAPSIFITGPLLTTYRPKVYENLGDDEPFILTKSIEDGINGVREQLKYDPDFIKIWYIAGADGLSVAGSAKKNLPIVKAIIEEAHKNNLKVAVHATQQITARLAVENGADFLVHSVEDGIVDDDFISLLKENNTIICPTLIVHGGYDKTFGQRLDFSNHELLTADPYQLGTLLDLKHLSDTLLVENYFSYSNAPISIASYNKTDSIRLVNLKKLSDAGVTIATGTDAGNIGTLHASSYLPELKAMQRSGMNNWQILEASTINGAKILDKEGEFGSVKTGKRANLVLLDSNPIEDIDNLSKINKIVNKGDVFAPNDLLKNKPEDLAQRQLNAYNMRNIDAFLEPYAEDVEIYMYPETLLYKGKETMRTEYASMFEMTPNLHCELKERIVQGNIVIDKESVRFGTMIFEAVAIYHIEGGKIQKVFFIQ